MATLKLLSVFGQWLRTFAHSSQFEFLDVRYFALSTRYEACTVLVQSSRSKVTGFDGWGGELCEC
jgi:hypothetical protein